MAGDVAALACDICACIHTSIYVHIACFPSRAASVYMSGTFQSTEDKIPWEGEAAPAGVGKAVTVAEMAEVVERAAEMAEVAAAANERI